MDELIGRLVAKIGVDRAAAAKAAGGILLFPNRAEQAHAFITRMPRAAAVACTSQPDTNCADMSVGDMMDTGKRKPAARSTTIPAAACGALEYACEMAGGDAAGDIAGAIPSRVQ